MINSKSPRGARIFSLVALALMIGGCQQANDAQTPDSKDAADVVAPSKAAPASGFAKMDANSDGNLTADEHAGAAATMFTAMDKDNDGAVTAAEMDAAQGAMGGSGAISSADKIKVIDTNRDGRLSKEEHVAGSQMMFSKMDTDANGTLNEAEFDVGHKVMLGK